MRLAPVACCLLLACGSPEYTPPPMAELDDLTCQPEVVANVSPWAGQRLGAGGTVELGSIGNDDTALDLFRTAVLGAPQAQVPKIRVVELDRRTGAVAAGGRTQDLAPPTGHPVTSFGRALLSRDVRECWGSGSPLRACGEELLVGASGYVALFEPTPDANLALYTWAGSVQSHTPASSISSASFGTAIAAADLADRGGHRWRRGDAHPPWVAISAPGFLATDCAVEIYQVDPASPTPLTWVQDLAWPASGSCAGKEFGAALAAGDFDGDGLTDLAVGAPKDGDGAVYVFRGTTGPVPLDDTHPPESPFELRWSGGLEFGASLDAGPTRVDADEVDSLIVGAPGTPRYASAEVGGLCDVRLTPSPGGFRLDPWDQVCFVNDVIGWNPGDRFGASVAVGNFSDVDGKGGMESAEADIAEIAVGAPGFGGDGAVEVYLTGPTGVHPTRLVADIRSPFPGTGEAFGAALASGFVEDNDIEDLIVGAPAYSPTDDGAASITRAEAVFGCGSSGAMGMWEAFDLRGLPVRIRVAERGDGTLFVTFVDPFLSSLVDATGTCLLDTNGDGIPDPMTFEVPAGTSLLLDPTWDCAGGSPQTWTGVDGTAILESTLRAAGLPEWAISTGETLVGGAPSTVVLDGAGPVGSLAVTIDFSEADLALLGALQTALLGGRLGPTCQPAPIALTRLPEGECD